MNKTIVNKISTIHGQCQAVENEKKIFQYLLIDLAVPEIKRDDMENDDQDIDI